MTSVMARDLVIQLLKTLELAQTDWDPRSNGDGVIRMPSLYREGSYPELERRLVEMRDNGLRPQWWHVSMRYRWRALKRLVVHSRKTIKGRIPELPPRSELYITGETLPEGLMVVHCYVWSDEVNPVLAEAGIDHLTAAMYGGDTSRITLPLPLLYPLLGLRGREDTRGYELRASGVQADHQHQTTGRGGASDRGD